MPDWLELELAHRLAPAEAPDELWKRLQNGSRRRPPRRPVWPVAAIVTVMIAVGAMWMAAKGASHARDLNVLAAAQLNSADPLDLQSTHPGEIREWGRRCGVRDFQIAPAKGVELLGARLAHEHGEPIAAVSYRVNGRQATLLIASALWKGNTPHAGLAIAGADSGCGICHSSL